MAKRKRKAKKPQTTDTIPQTMKEQMAKLAASAHAGGAAWMHDILTAAGYCRKGDRITKGDAENYGRMIGDVIEKLCVTVAETDKDLAAKVHEKAKQEIAALQ